MARKPITPRNVAGFLVTLACVVVYTQFIAPHLESTPEQPAGQSEGRAEQGGAAGQLPDSKGRPEAARAGDSKLGGKSDLPLGALRKGASGDYVSSAGLRYTRGGPEGHRLDHVRRHDDDIPNREGSHGVFDGDEAEMLAVIDEAYLLVKNRSAAANIRQEEGRTICTVDMKRDIGFLGGASGKRQGHPDLRRVRLVLEGERLITAYPVK